MFEGFTHRRVRTAPRPARASWLIVLVCLSVPASVRAETGCPQGPEIVLPTVCGVAVPNPRISCAVPSDVAPGVEAGGAAQRGFNVFGWQEFIALNWPAAPTGRGRPDA